MIAHEEIKISPVCSSVPKSIQCSSVIQRQTAGSGQLPASTRFSWWRRRLMLYVANIREFMKKNSFEPDLDKRPKDVYWVWPTVLRSTN